MERRRQNVEVFVSQDGKAPYEVWFNSLGDASDAAQVILAIEELRSGKFELCRSIGCGVFEKRIPGNPTFRIFFALVGTEGLLLLTGSHEASKRECSEKALKIWKEFKANAH